MSTPLHEKKFASDETLKLPRPFLLRRLHSLLGVWLVIYLFEHLFVNSQMALYFHDQGSSFVGAVNKIHNVPYLRAIEIIFLAFPFIIHGYWGVLYVFTAKANSQKTDGTKPALTRYKRNKAYTWQRFTAWILVIGIIAHVVQMRFIDYPVKEQNGFKVMLKEDRGLKRVAKTLGVTLTAGKDQQVVAIAPSMGAAFFLVVRQAFINPLLVILYSVFVVAASYHGFNGIWTFMITWGITLSHHSQRVMHYIMTILMWLVMLLGLMSIWGTYLTTVYL